VSLCIWSQAVHGSNWCQTMRLNYVGSLDANVSFVTRRLGCSCVTVKTPMGIGRAWPALHMGRSVRVRTRVRSSQMVPRGGAERAARPQGSHIPMLSSSPPNASMPGSLRLTSSRATRKAMPGG